MESNTILVFGFEKFGGLTSNPSQLVVEELARENQPVSGYQLVPCVLPTEYAASAQLIESLILENDPFIVLGLGVAASRQSICLERFALNIDDVDVKDNAGCLRVGKVIETNGPAALTTTADLSPILKKLTDRRIPATISNHAGTYVCNHAYYRALRKLQLENRKTDCLFVHLPAVDEETNNSIENQYQWTIQKLMKVVKLIIAELVDPGN